MFEVDQTRAFVSSVNMRAEKHGDDNKLASDIKFEVHLSNTILDEFDKGLKAALYREVRKGEKPDLIGDNKFAAVRFPLLDGFRWEEEFTGYKVSIGSELGLVEALELSDITLKKFAFDPKEGGSVVVTFNAIAHPTSDEAGELCALIQEHVNLTLIAPTAESQKSEKSAKASKGDILEDQDAKDKARADAVADAVGKA